MRLKFLASFSFCVAAIGGSLSAQSPATDDPLVNGSKLSTVASSTLSTPKDTYWVGEVFPLIHTIAVKRNAFQSLGEAYDWTATGFNAEDWSLAAPGSEDGRSVLIQKTRAYSAKPGAIKLPSGKQELVLITRVVESTFGNQTETDKFVVKSVTPTVNFKPLPEPAPGFFGGAVGDFNLTSKISATTVNAGESVTWTLQLSGSGNWPEIRELPPRAISKDFDYVKPVIKRNMKKDSLFDGDLTEEMLLIPTKPGTYQLGPIKFVYFNPKEGKYQMLTSETITLTVTGSSTGLSSTRKSDAAAKATQQGERTPVPEAPPILPLDPLNTPETGLTPFAPFGLTIAAVIPLIALVIYWLSLAARRRWSTDALHGRREARARIATVLKELENHQATSNTALREKLFAWQKATADFGGVTSSTPTPAQIAKAIEGGSRGTVGSSWAQLWRESNRVIFGHNVPLPADWILRANAALSDKPVPAVPLGALFARRNLLPFLSLIAVMLLAPLALKADAGADAYRSGDFATAEKSWRAAVTANPLDATARYNLSLATAQQDRWAESATQALAAFCLKPRDPTIRWQFNLSLDRSGIDQPAFTGFARGEGFYKIARQFSAGGWALVLIASSLLFAIALGFALRGAFKNLAFRSCWLSGGLAVIGLLLGLSSVISLRCYGQLTQRDIAVVSQSTLLCTVPTDVNPSQKTSPLPAGSLAQIDRSFLTWSHVKFPNGQTGWVRTELLTFLYQ